MVRLLLLIGALLLSYGLFSNSGREYFALPLGVMLIVAGAAMSASALALVEWILTHSPFARHVRPKTNEVDAEPNIREPAIEELIQALKTGTVRQKCNAAEHLGRQGEKLVSALADALHDQSEETFQGAWGAAVGSTYYVREAVVHALAKIDPSAAAPSALQAIADLTGKPSSFCSFGEDYEMTLVKFPPEVIAHFEACTR